MTSTADISNTNESAVHALALFSGGLDSILAALVIQEQGLKVKCLHFVTPFFGKPELVDHWRRIYGLDIETVDISEEYVAMLAKGPHYGFGKYLNPCVDCKILMAGKARELLDEYGASFIISGEVLGQRPMSQRRDTLNSILRRAGVRDLLLRPLCAKRLDPTPWEETGLVDRERLLGITGRGRKRQMELAEKFKLAEIPTPAGGCRLAEQESARRYWPILEALRTSKAEPRAADFVLADTGRQYWAGQRWLSIGRNQKDNETLEGLAEPGDVTMTLVDFPSPLAVGRRISGGGLVLDPADIADAAAFAASFSPKAVKSGGPVRVAVTVGSNQDILTVTPSRETPLGWKEPVWNVTGKEKNGSSAGPE